MGCPGFNRYEGANYWVLAPSVAYWAGTLRVFSPIKCGATKIGPQNLAHKFEKIGSKDNEVGVGKYSELEARMSWSS